MCALPARAHCPWSGTARTARCHSTPPSVDVQCCCLWRPGKQLSADSSASRRHLLALQGQMIKPDVYAGQKACHQKQGSVLATPAASPRASSAECFLLQTLYNALLENNCSEQASRMAAMESSTKNATEMISKLSLQYNRWAASQFGSLTSNCSVAVACQVSADQFYCPAEPGKQPSPLSLSRLSQEQQPSRLESSRTECERFYPTECK